MNQQNCSCCADGCTAGIVSANAQRIVNLFPSQTAIRNGTLYPDLYKPMHCAGGPCGGAEPCPAQTIAFSAWEVRLYLNTHPADTGALQLYHQLCQQSRKPNYACTFAPCSGERWHWVDDPWPWECAAAGRRA